MKKSWKESVLLNKLTLGWITGVMLLGLVFSGTGLLASPPRIKIISGIVKKGETASSLLNAYLPLKEIYALDKKSKKIFPLTRIRKGQPYQIRILADSLMAFEYEINQENQLVILKTDNTYSISKKPIQYEIRRDVVTVDIESSLSRAVAKAGEHPSLTWKLADIFAWDIDFIRDIQPRDRFQALVEKRYRHKKFYGYGDILAAFFTNKGVEYKAFLYKEGNKKFYYNEQGQSLQKAFLKAPLNYSKITSRFSKRRFHPILKRYRAHPGVDYAAPRNTPIKAVADGTIVSIGYNKSMGRNITIRHINGYETSYYHMNKYARGMKKNRKVCQGDIIGYVGKTGLATGYHLCFRMRKNGCPVNPLKQASACAPPVQKKHRDLFKRLAVQYTEKIMAARKLARVSP